MRPILLLVLAAAVLGGCGGGSKSLGTVPNNTSARPVSKPLVRPIVVRLHGRSAGTAKLRGAASGQKTSVQIAVKAAGAVTAELAEGSCSAPTALKSTTVLGQVHGGRASWTVPTPYAQLTSTPLAVVVRSKAHAVEACGNAPKG